MSSGSGAIAEATTPDPTMTTATRRDALLVAGAKVLVSLAVLWTGFRAVSDDDFARVVIAQRFAHAPSLDPSGTSWLPLPFWLNGGVMDVFGSSIDVARATAFVLGIAAAVVVHVAARWLGASRRGALLGALLACCIPYAAWLGVATVPDYPTAALILLGAAGAAAPPRQRFIASLALAAACLSRYEAWPVAAAFALFAVWDAFRRRSWWFGASALVAAAGPLGWMLHGVMAHGDALFFVNRVAAYRRAVGAAPASVLVRLTAFPLRVLRCEPEVAVVSLAALGAAVSLGLSTELRRYRRAGILLLALLVFLVVGDLRDGAPTHHAERAVLAIWLAGAVLTGDLGPARLEGPPRARPRRVHGAAGRGRRARHADGPALVRPPRRIHRPRARDRGGREGAPCGPSAWRARADRHAGLRFLRHHRRARPPVAGRPARRSRPAPPASARPVRSTATLRARARAAHARYLIATGAHVLSLPDAGDILAGSSRYMLVRLRP